MRVLFINPNVFRTPPCIPVGIEYAASALEQHGHTVHVFDSFNFANPLDELGALLSQEKFDLAAVSFRNIDTAQAGNYAFFVPGLRALVQDLQAAELPVLLGGSGFSAMPEEILEYTGADHGIVGPAGLVLPGFCATAGTRAGAGQPRIIDARRIGIDPNFVPNRGEHFNYKTYFHYGGIAGFATQYGCPSNCLYCIEAGTPHLLRNPSAVVEELHRLCVYGIEEYHLCDSEFNHSLNHCLSFLEHLEAASLDIRWALYMRPVPFTDSLAESLRRTGAYIVTISVDSAEACRNGGAYGWNDVSYAIQSLRSRGIRTAIDLSLGMPDEPEDNARIAINFFKECRADSVNVNAWYRVYGGTGLEALLRRRPDLHRFLSAPMPDGAPLEKLFFNCLDTDRINELIGEDPSFKLEGFHPGTNYELLR